MNRSGSDRQAAGLDPGRLRTPRAAATWLRSARAVRDRANQMLALAEREELEHFRLDSTRMGATADYVVAVIAERYPTLAIPFHSRWRHFSSGGIDRWEQLAQSLGQTLGQSPGGTSARAAAHVLTPSERARIRFDLAVTSVLLDAGAGSRWRYRDPVSGVSLNRSEGLAAASFEVFRQGMFSSQAHAPLRADAAGLAEVTAEALGTAIQVSETNPLVGLEPRAALLRRLGAALTAHPVLFEARAPRVGNLFDYLAARATGGTLPAPIVLEAILEGLSGVWPERPRLAGIELGDVWRHPAIESGDASEGWVPFHKLSQWLAYSLVEPLEEAGIRVSELDALTGLPEYRNGGLLIDLGLLQMRDSAATTRLHFVDSPLVVEWRALTVALLDRLAERIRERLGQSAEALPLLKILEGGTWHAGRKIAAELRGDAAPPPVRVISDGTVF